MNYVPAQVVYSKCGRDKGSMFIIISAEENYVYLADGRSRTLEKPKRKKVKHIQKTNFVHSVLHEKLVSGAYIQNADIEKVLKEYIEKEQ